MWTEYKVTTYVGIADDSLHTAPASIKSSLASRAAERHVNGVLCERLVRRELDRRMRVLGISVQHVLNFTSIGKSDEKYLFVLCCQQHTLCDAAPAGHVAS